MGEILDPVLYYVSSMVQVCTGIVFLLYSISIFEIFRSHFFLYYYWSAVYKKALHRYRYGRDAHTRFNFSFQVSTSVRKYIP